MPLGTEIGLGPGHIVSDGTQLLLPQRLIAPIFGPSIMATRSPISATAEHLFSFSYVHLVVV